MTVWLILVTVAVTMLIIFWRRKASADLTQLIDQRAPDFKLPDQHGKIHTLQDYSGKWLALYFYPKDDTPGCTKQACGFRDDLQELAELGAAVVGVSVDSTNSHAGFAKKYQLQFPLLADRDAEIAARYHSLIDLGIVKFARRNTFLISPQGKIAKVYFSASAARNPAQVVAELKKCQTINLAAG